MLKEFIKYYKPYRKLFLLDFTCAIIVAILELAFPVMVHRVIDEVLPQQNVGIILVVGFSLVALYATSTVLNYIVVSFGHLLGINIETDMRRNLFAHIQKQSFSFFDNMKIGELLSRLSSDLFDISEDYLQQLILVVKMLSQDLKHKFNYNDINIIQSSGKLA